MTDEPVQGGTAIRVGSIERRRGSMASQALISCTIVGLVIARAVNAFGS